MEEIHSDTVHCVQMLYNCYIYNADYVTATWSKQYEREHLEKSEEKETLSSE